MSYYTTFKAYTDVLNYLKTVDYPQCFTVNYKHDTEEYALWIGNQPYYVYDEWIDEGQQKVRELKKDLDYWKLNYYVKAELSIKLSEQLKETEQKLNSIREYYPELFV